MPHILKRRINVTVILTRLLFFIGIACIAVLFFRCNYSHNPNGSIQSNLNPKHVKCHPHRSQHKSSQSLDTMKAGDFERAFIAIVSGKHYLCLNNLMIGEFRYCADFNSAPPQKFKNKFVNVIRITIFNLDINLLDEVIQSQSLHVELTSYWSIANHSIRSTSLKPTTPKHKNAKVKNNSIQLLRKSTGRQLTNDSNNASIVMIESSTETSLLDDLIWMSMTNQDNNIIIINVETYTLFEIEKVSSNRILKKFRQIVLHWKIKDTKQYLWRIRIILHILSQKFRIFYSRLPKKKKLFNNLHEFEMDIGLIKLPHDRVEYDTMLPLS